MPPCKYIPWDESVNISTFILRLWVKSASDPNLCASSTTSTIDVTRLGLLDGKMWAEFPLWTDLLPVVLEEDETKLFWGKSKQSMFLRYNLARSDIRVSCEYFRYNLAGFSTSRNNEASSWNESLEHGLGELWPGSRSDLAIELSEAEWKVAKKLLILLILSCVKWFFFRCEEINDFFKSSYNNWTFTNDFERWYYI